MRCVEVLAAGDVVAAGDGDGAGAEGGAVEPVPEQAEMTRPSAAAIAKEGGRMMLLVGRIQQADEARSLRVARLAGS